MLRSSLRYIYVAVCLITLSPCRVVAQPYSEAETEEVRRLMAEIDSLNTQLNTIEETNIEEAKESIYKPQLWGSMMILFNHNTYTGEEQFAVHNAHVGVIGNASKNISYLLHVNYNNLGSLTVLEMNTTYRYKRFYSTLGQQCILLTTDFDRCGPRGNLFTSRSYSVLFSLQYATESEIGHLSVGDIGVYNNYVFDWDVPVTLSLGLFNGTGMNRIEWDNHINVMSRVQFGGATGVSGGASLYTGHTPFDQDLTIWSGELRYVTDRLFVEGVYQQRRIRDYASAPLQQCHTGILQSLYKIPTPESRWFDNYTPALRYDFGTNVDYYNMVTGCVEQQSASRISALMHLGLKGAKVRSRLSVGYEKVFKSERPTDFSENPLFQDRFVVGISIGY